VQTVMTVRGLGRRGGGGRTSRRKRKWRAVWADDRDARDTLQAIRTWIAIRECRKSFPSDRHRHASFRAEAWWCIIIIIIIIIITNTIQQPPSAAEFRKGRFFNNIYYCSPKLFLIFGIQTIPYDHNMTHSAINSIFYISIK